MTHDELLSRLLISDKTDLYKTLTLWQAALCKVIELHKPSEYNSMVCGECTGSESVWYPCGTIDAIKKELNRG